MSALDQANDQKVDAADKRVTWIEATQVAIGTSVLFLVLYSGVAYLTDFRSDVGTWYYSWEQFIPFVPLMIVPYMSIDLFYVLAPYVCRDRRELTVLTQRLSAVVVLAAICFLIYPLRLAVDRPVAEGFFGGIYNWFVLLDHRPYNLCPSMHIALRTVLAAHYARHTRGSLRVLMHVWFFLIGCSTLLLHQHHVIDVVGGFVLAFLVMYAWDGMPWRLPKSGGWRQAVAYGAGSTALVLPVLWLPKLGWLLFWPSLASGLVAFGYAWAGPAIYRRRDGRMTWPARWVLGPVLAGQWLSWKYYSRKSDAVDHVDDGVWIGRQLTAREARQWVESGSIAAVVDCTSAFNEAPALRGIHRLELPVLDLTAPSQRQLRDACEFIERHRHQGVLVHCKAGYSRSAAIVAAWLIRSGRADSKADAFAQLRKARPQIVIRPEIRSAKLHPSATPQAC